jgi:hypothetical protein
MAQEWPEGQITDGGTLWEREMRRIERVREEEERLGRTGIRRQGDGLIGIVP